MPFGLLILFAVAIAALVLLGSVGVAWYLTHPPRRTEGSALAEGIPFDPQQAGYGYEAIELDAEGGTLELWLVPGQATDGPAFVLLHGWGDSRIGSLAWLDALVPIASHVVLFDMRGHGNSPFPRCTWGRYEVGDVRAAVDALRQRGCDSPVVLIGGSLGGAIMAMAAIAGVDCAGVVADSPYLNSTDVTRRVVRRMGLPPWPIVDLGWWMIRAFGAKEHRSKPAQVVGQLRVPLLVLHGDDDAVVPVADAKALADAASDGVFVSFPRSDHLMPAAEHEDAYRDAISDWLAARRVSNRVDAG